jgi:preprotein translocase subunit SecD
LIVATLLAACTDDGGTITTVTPSASPAIGKGGAFQIRAVEAIAAPGTTAFDLHQPTCGPDPEPACTDDLLLDPADITLEGADGTRFVLGRLVADGGNVASAAAIAMKDDSWVVEVTLDADGAATFESATSAAVSAPPPENQIAIVVDGVVVSAPAVQTPITSGQVVVAGNFARRDAEELAAGLEGS